MFKSQMHNVPAFGAGAPHARGDQTMVLGAALLRLRDGFLGSAMLNRRLAAGRETASSHSLLEATILPFYRESDAHQRLLFVGCDRHTAGYERLFAKKTFRTFDGDAARAPFGAARHQVAPMRNMVFLLPPESVDTIICNGSSAWGAGSRGDIKAACEAALRTLRPGGHLVIVINDREPETSVPLDSIAALHGFAVLDFPPLRSAEPAVARTARRFCRFYRKPSHAD